MTYTAALKHIHDLRRITLTLVAGVSLSLILAVPATAQTVPGPTIAPNPVFLPLSQADIIRQHEAPGTVIANVDPPTSAGIKQSASIRRVAYVTRDAFNKPALSTAVMMIPTGTPPAGGWPVIAFAHGTTGLADVDAPSNYGVVDFQNAISNRYNLWLSKGYAVAATDYAGLGTPGILQYLNGKVAAHGVLDSVRALRNLSPTVGNTFAVTGWSQGGHASLFTGRYAAEYAPELKLKAIVASGPASNIEKLAILASPEFPRLPLTGFIVYMTYIIAGFNDTHRELNVTSYLTDLGKKLVGEAGAVSRATMHKNTEGLALGQLFSKKLNDPVLLVKLNEYMAVPVSGYSQPIFITQGLYDTTVPAPLTWKLDAELHKNKQDVDLKTYYSNHYPAFLNSMNDEWAFIEKNMAKELAP